MTTALDLTVFKALSVDCYGTLIDWEAGISAVLAPWAAERGLDLADEDLLLAYAVKEAAVEREAPTALYPAVLSEAFRPTGITLGEPVSDQWAARLGSSVPDWPAFPDSAAALGRLARHFQLIILSNVDRAGFAGSNQRLRGEFAAVITAEMSAPTSPLRTTSAHSMPHCPGSVLTGTGYCMSRRASSMTMWPPSVKASRRCGSTAATTDPAEERRRNRPGVVLRSCISLNERVR